MALIERSEVKVPSLPRETVEVPALGGEVIVRGLLLSERLELSGFHERLADPMPGETDEQARSRAGGQIVAFTLSRAVVLADGKPLYTQTEWDTFGSKNPDAALDLFNRSRVLAGLDDKDNAKN
jgi:hypothetical protein